MYRSTICFHGYTRLYIWVRAVSRGDFSERKYWDAFKKPHRINPKVMPTSIFACPSVKKLVFLWVSVLGISNVRDVISTPSALFIHAPDDPRSRNGPAPALMKSSRYARSVEMPLSPVRNALRLSLSFPLSLYCVCVSVG